MKRKITIDTLAGIVQREFVQLDERIGKVELEIKSMRIEMKEGFDTLNKTLKDGFRMLIGDMTEIKEKQKKIDDHENRIKYLEFKASTRK